MANEEQLFVLRQGVEAWKRWRNNNAVIKVDLCHADLRFTDLTGAKLSRADLTGANLTRAKLCGADLTEAKLSRADLYNADLYNANLTRAKLSEANLTEASLIKVDFSTASLRRAVLKRSNLAHSKLVRADLTNADLIDANLAGADLTEAILSEAKLNGTILSKNINTVDSRKSWITPLRAIQTDFIQRLQSGHLLNHKTAGQYSELSLISGERLEKLRAFCWNMADKYKEGSEVHKIFTNNLKGKLGEEVVKYWLAEFVTEVDDKETIGGDGKIDFNITTNPSIGIQVKTRYDSDSLSKVKWEISSEELAKNAVIICILSQENFKESQTEHKLITAGFLPTYMIKANNSKALIGINELLYAGGLKSYIESIYGR